jgi:hypothetical protein
MFGHRRGPRSVVKMRGIRIRTPSAAFAICIALPLSYHVPHHYCATTSIIAMKKLKSLSPEIELKFFVTKQRNTLPPFFGCDLFMMPVFVLAHCYYTALPHQFLGPLAKKCGTNWAD